MTPMALHRIRTPKGTGGAGRFTTRAKAQQAEVSRAIPIAAPHHQAPSPRATATPAKPRPTATGTNAKATSRQTTSPHSPANSPLSTTDHRGKT
jgi:hypothetical protein